MQLTVRVPEILGSVLSQMVDKLLSWSTVFSEADSRSANQRKSSLTEAKDPFLYS